MIKFEASVLSVIIKLKDTANSKNKHWTAGEIKHSKITRSDGIFRSKTIINKVQTS